MVKIDYRDGRPIYEQVADGIEELALRGALPAETQLPSVRQFAMELSINPNTIQRAYGELERRGVIYAAKGRGNFVSDVGDRREERLREVRAEMTALAGKARSLGADDAQLTAWVTQKGEVYGLIGSNGAGKSTFLRMLAGILAPDEGEVWIDGEKVFENTAVKNRCFFISDEQFFFPNSTPQDMKNYYRRFYDKFDEQRYFKLMSAFGLDETRKIRTFSKGMKKQVSVICGVCSGTDYLFCDETFDGLDPVVRQAVKSLFAEDVAERGLTPVIASHNLRELEDICDHVGLLHRGGILFSRDLDEMKLGMYKVQCIFASPLPEDAWDGFDLLKKEQRGSLYTIIARGDREELMSRLNKMNPTFCELLPLTLEEIFINETEVAGYDVKKLLF